MFKYVVHSGNNSRLLIRPLLEQRGNWVEATEQEAEDFKAQFIWKPTVYHVRVIPTKAYNQMDELFISGFGIMIHNHLENNREITTKTGLIRSLRNFYQNNEFSIKAGYQVHDTIPTSYIITAQVEDEEFRQMVNRFTEIQNGLATKEKLPAKHCEKNMWLVKPAALNQGRGIEVCRTLKDINNMLRTKPMHSVWLVQKYVEKPLLFKGRKFDIRIWAMATAKHDFFYYRHGYLRTSSSEYDTQATDNFIHLTNNCLQKFGENYGVHEKGNTLSFDAFQEYLDATFPQYSINFFTQLLPRIKDLMIDSYLSGKKSMHKGKRNRVFELFGFDFLIDEDFRVWLIEVNTNPYLGIPNEYIEKLLPVMIDDLLALVLDTHIPPKNPRSRKENDFELLYCEVASIYSPDGTSKNYRNPYSNMFYPIPELSQVPLCKFKTEEDPHPPPLETIKPVTRDILQTVKDELELSTQHDISDFSTISSRVMSQLNNWELMSEEQINAGIQALQLLSASNGVQAFVVFNHLNSFINLCFSEDVPGFLQIGVLEAVVIGCQDTKFRKEVVKLGITENLINLVLDSEIESLFKKQALKAMIVISTHPTKKVYIPGETREHNWVRSKLLSDGMLLCFFKLGQEAEESMAEMVKQHLQTEYELSDWELQLTLLERLTEDSSSILIPKAPRNSSVRLSPEGQSNSLLKDHDSRLPKSLNDKQFLNSAKAQIKQFCDNRREEIRQKLERDKQKKLEDEENKVRQRELEDREYEEKRQKVEEYANKRYEEIRKQKFEELKKQKETRVNEEKFDEYRKQLIIEKLKKTEEIKRVQRAKLKKQEEELKKNEEQKKREIEEKRKKVMEEWLKSKNEKEREKKQLEKQKKEEEQVKREAEMQLRKEELLLRIEEKKIRMKKLKEEKKEKAIHKKNDSLLAEESSRIMLEKEDLLRNNVMQSLISPPRATPFLKDMKLKKKKFLDKKKRKLISVPDQFLFDVYGSHPSKPNVSQGKEFYSFFQA